ncbi:MAG: EF-Tu/IF-2/RF-3 family GTPase [Candidatus Marsarchaeota archaeon]|nr:EF-Tu/IF-2/RF-3 family GTPase [Candidatus Marsarchaeota archaeon]
MNHIVSVPLDEGLASFIGKKGSVNGITFFNRRHGDDVIVALYPTDADGKPYGLAESMLVSEQIVISTADIGKAFGEVLIAASLLGKRVLLTNDRDAGKFTSGGLLKDCEVVGREELLGKITAYRPGRGSGSDAARVDIDKAFPVTGIGTVVLGVVISGTVKVHDVLHHNSGKSITVRSMQSQDIDIKEAQPGTRVGMAIKGMEHGEIEKGDVFSSVPIPSARKAYARLSASRIAGEQVREGAQYLMVSNFSHVNARIKAGAEAELSLERPMPLLSGDAILLMRQQQPRIFASGVITRAEQ